MSLITSFNDLAYKIYHNNVEAGWWKRDPVTGIVAERNIGELLALVHSEVSEAALGDFLDINDDHLPNRKMVEVELADVEIRLLDIVGHYKIDVDTIASILGEQYESIHQMMVKTGADSVGLTEALMVLHIDVTNALEGARKGRDSTKIAGYKAFDVAITEAIIRVMEISMIFNFDVTGAIFEKLEYNANRADHKIEAREKDGGKKF